MAFNIKLPTWTNQGTKPTKNLSNIGFQAGDRGVPASILNWLFHNVFAGITELQGEVINHENNQDNPHNVTASQIGAMPASGGMLTGDTVAAAASDLSTPLVRNVVTVSSEDEVANISAPTGTLICVQES